MKKPIALLAACLLLTACGASEDIPIVETAPPETETTTTFVESISTTAFAREEEEKKGMDASQVTGASSSYARKYCLNGLFAIDDTKDSDFTNTATKGDNSGLSEAQIKRLLAIASKVNISADDVKIVVAKSFGVQDLRKMNKQQYDEICSILEKKGSK